MSKNILISTGGSGGHVIPSTIIYDHLKTQSSVYISSDLRGSKFLDEKKYGYTIIDTPKISNNFFQLPFKIFLISILILKSFFLLKKKDIKILISTGGYMSLPLILASKILRVKIFLFEPNMVIGRANKFFLKFSEKIFCYSKNIKNFPRKFIPKQEIIYPLIRKEFYQYHLLKKKKNDQLNLLIIGGSQGAKIFDKEIKDSIIELKKKYDLKIYQQTNFENIENLKNFYNDNNIKNYIFEYDDSFLNIISKTDLCITRAGASTLSELIFLNIPFLAIPLPSSKDNHQYENANYYKDKNCCWILDQKEFNKGKLLEILNDIISNKNDFDIKIKNMKNLSYENSWNNINQKIVRIINEN